jgi:hypothetical protein
LIGIDHLSAFLLSVALPFAEDAGHLVSIGIVARVGLALLLVGVVAEVGLRLEIWSGLAAILLLVPILL